MPLSWKGTMMVLIPKQQNDKLVSQYVPIYLCTTIYKVIIKILVNRIKPLFDNLFSKYQGALILGRYITSNCFMA